MKMAKFWSKFLVWNIVRTYVLSSSSSSTWNISSAFAECWHIGPKFEDLKEMILKWPRIHFISRRKLKYQSACKAIREREKVPALTCQCTVMNGCHCITFFSKPSFTCYTTANSISKFNVISTKYTIQCSKSKQSFLALANFCFRVAKIWWSDF